MRNLFISFCLLLFVFKFLNGPVSGLCLEDQRDLLVQLKQELLIHNPDSSSSTIETKLDTWSSSSSSSSSSWDCCFWEGVTCDHQTGNVIGLDLSSSSIIGGINGTSNLFKLQHLHHLNLAHNRVSSPFPSSFGELHNLTRLNLSYSGFHGRVPREISLLTKLVSLDLSADNYLEEPYLEEPHLEMLIRNLTNLRELILDGIDLSNTGNNEWSRIIPSSLPNLRVLSLSNCNLLGPIHHSLPQLLPFLTHLNLSWCELSGRFPDAIFSLPNLRTLDISVNAELEGSFPEFPPGSVLEVIRLSYTKFQGNMPNSISNVKLLRELRLRLCNFSGQFPAPSFDSFAELVSLDLFSNSFTGSLPSLASSKKVVELHLSENDFRDTIPSSYGDVLMNLETLGLSSNSLRGAIPSSLFSIPSINSIYLDNNRLSGQIQDFPNATVSTSLKNIDLSGNELQGPIPTSIFRLTSLETLLLLNNNFSGTIDAGMFGGLKYLYKLGISGSSNLFFDVSGGNTTSLAQISYLQLNSCNMRAFPNFLRNNSVSDILDLSDNKITGEVPKWVWDVPTYSLNLSHNLLIGFEKSGANNLTSASIVFLDLHSNLLQGPLLDPHPQVFYYLDYSNNNLASDISSDFFNQVSNYTFFVSLANNDFVGEIPLSICKATSMQVLDMSGNRFNGSIPPCLGLATSLRTLDLNRNHMEGTIPRSLTNCTSLEVLDLGNNRLNGSFPIWLENLPRLRLLVLRSNNFGGSIGHSPRPTTTSGNVSFPSLQIIDISSNEFKGRLPANWFRSWNAMKKLENRSELREVLGINLNERFIYYQDSVTITVKGLNVEYVKILRICTSIDVSDNQFEGTIPEVIGELRGLFALNMSRNSFTGQIPSSFGELSTLESLDLSRNRLSGKIPLQLNKLTFLSFLNLSGNQLAGEIPRGPQIGTFGADSFEGNVGLCGPPLSSTCHSFSSPVDQSNTFNAKASEAEGPIDWGFFWSGFGCGGGVGTIGGLIIGYAIVGNLITSRRRNRTRKCIRQL